MWSTLTRSTSSRHPETELSRYTTTYVGSPQFFNIYWVGSFCFVLYNISSCRFVRCGRVKKNFPRTFYSNLVILYQIIYVTSFSSTQYYSELISKINRYPIFRIKVPDLYPHSNGGQIRRASGLSVPTVTFIQSNLDIQPGVNFINAKGRC